MALGDMMARSQAAQGMIRGGAEGGEGLPPEAGLPEEAGLEAAPPAVDLESALAGVEAAIEGEAPEKAEEIRTHLNAIREIAAGGAEGEGGPPEPPLLGEGPATELPPGLAS